MKTSLSLSLSLLLLSATALAQFEHIPRSSHAALDRDLVPRAPPALSSPPTDSTTLNITGSIPSLHDATLDLSADSADARPDTVDEHEFALMERRSRKSKSSKKKKNKCPAKKKKNKAASTAASASVPQVKLVATSSPKATTTTEAEKKKAASTKDVVAAAVTTKVATIGGAGLFKFVSDNCGASDADDDYPNGAEAFLNCGLSKFDKSSPWTPPAGVTVDHLKVVSIEEAIASNSVWEPCSKFTTLFEKYGEKHGIPPIMLAALALQESTCNPNVLGDSGGAFGLMQITQDKCNGMGAAGCSAPDYNIDTAAAYLASQIKAANGNILTALGQYNGWVPGMTFTSATAAEYSDCCECQNNLDYLHQMLNGWLLGKTGYEMGSYNNLKMCSNQS
ncbi:glycoside hydrolase family 23 protein [Pseudohyphozyma bogoriensis]|nr:glycoside hydrolase family 23 protein [Pseudohyphozyma bogoriensis]